MGYIIKPEKHELREARRIVSEAIEASKAVQEKQTDLKISLGWIEDSFTVENLKGVHGFTHSPEIIELNFNTSSDWKQGLKAFTPHEYAHAIFFEENSMTSEDVQFNWQHVLMEAHAQHFSERVYPDIDAAWRENLSKEELADRWPELREKMSSELIEEAIIDSENYGLFFGYTLAYRIGEKLLENHELEELSQLKRSDVVEAGDELFG